MIDFESPVEVWNPIPSLPGYEISSCFRIRSRRSRWGLSDKWHPVRVFRPKKDYLGFTAQKDGKQLSVLIHWVVAEIAYGPRPPGMQVLHCDDDRTNNHPSNLYYGTFQHNADDRARNNRQCKGESHSNAKLTEADIREIRQRAAAGELAKDIAPDHGVSLSLVFQILQGKRWAHVR